MVKRDSGGIFRDLKVADFCWVGVGPIVGRMLGEFGATVIRVESSTRPDPLRTMPPFKDNIAGLNRSAFYAGPNCNKYSLSLDLNNPKAQDAARRLIAWADLMGESFGPGVMEKWGLGYGEAKKVNPEIIYYSTCMQGQTGPHRAFRGFGLHMAGVSGLSNILGWPDLEPVGPYGAFSDFIAWLWMRTLVLGALDYKRRTGKGQYIDLSQLEASIHFLTPWLLDYRVNGREGQRMGNQDRYACPHGVFRCLGKDRWIAIAVETEEEWKGFCRAMGDPEWCQEEKFASILSRKAHEEELNRRIDEGTSHFEAFRLMALLQSHGVGAGAVLDPSQTHADPQLDHRRAKVVLDHKEIGPHGYLTSGSQFSKTPPEFRKSAPLLGEDTQWILRDVLHYSEEEIKELEVGGALQ